MNFKHRNGTRICPFCGATLKKNGKIKSNRQRGYCNNCKRSVSPNINLINVNQTKFELKLFLKYLLNTAPLKYYKITKMQFNRMSKKFRILKLNSLCDINIYSKVIYLDPIYFSGECCMIVRNKDAVIGGGFYKKRKLSRLI